MIHGANYALWPDSHAEVIIYRGRQVMSEMVADCPRCSAKNITLDVYADIFRGLKYDWQTHHEVVGKCRHCHKPTIFKAELRDINVSNKFRADGSLANYKGVINDIVLIMGPITIREVQATPAPDYVPAVIADVFVEASSSYEAKCFNAAAAMFRLALDLATKGLLPSETAEGGPDRRQRKELAARLDWLFENRVLGPDLRELAACVREHGNDGVHDGTTTAVDAEDLLDFTSTMLERIYTEPQRVAEARARREQRRAAASSRP